jgi:hypothetical protein
MQRIWAKFVLAVGVGAIVIPSQGCKRQAVPAPAQTGGHTVPQPRPVQGLEPLPIADPVVDAGQPAQQRVRHRRSVAVDPQPVQPPVDTSQADAQAQEARQREQDAELLKQQEAASQRQQEELNRELQQRQKELDAAQAEPRIQDAPVLPPPAEPDPDAPRIQDAPGPAQTLPAQPTQPQTPPQE